MITIAIGPLVQTGEDRKKEKTDRVAALGAAMLDAIGEDGIRMVFREMLMEVDRDKLVDRLMSGGFADLSPASMAQHMAESFVEGVEEDLRDERTRDGSGGEGHGG